MSTAARVLVAAAALVAAVALAACGGGGSSPDPTPPAELGEAGCTSLAELSLERTEAITAVWREAGGGLAGQPAHCTLQGVIDRRTGVDGVAYGIRFELRLPQEWNGRFYFQGGYGTDGALLPALGPFPLGGNALASGYAVATTDAGHSGAGPEFGRDPRARIDYGYAALDLVALRAKETIGRYYGRAPEFSYLSGCSNGGRQGMVAAQRFPHHFDGILAGNPGFRLPQVAISEAWNTQAVAAIATTLDESGKPDLSSTFSDDDLRLLERGVLAACDDLDGLADGIVYDFPACAFDPGALTCPEAKTPTCLTAGQVSALRKIFGGPRNSRGEELYASFPWDAGLTSPLAFRSWILGSGGPGGGGLNTSLGAGALAYVFVTPPATTADPFEYVLGFDFDVDAPRIFATSGEFTESSVSFMNADSTAREEFRESGGKLLIYHGVSDAVFSVNDTIRWWDAVHAEDDDAASWVRVFPVPGMGHCGAGGAATDQFDAFPALVDWVESGVAPERIEATATALSPFPGRTRPLCPYPKQPRHLGSGSIESAASFDCR